MKLQTVSEKNRSKKHSEVLRLYTELKNEHPYAPMCTILEFISRKTGYSCSGARKIIKNNAYARVGKASARDTR